MGRRRYVRKTAYVFTPARRNALAKAREVRSLRAAGRRKAKVASTRRIYSSNPVARGQGVSGAKKNFVPYARVNQRSQTGGFNVGTILPGTGKRVVAGGYIRLENVKRGGVVSTSLNTLLPKNSPAGKARRWFNENVTVTNPGLRANIPGGQARLSTSRSGGATLTFRRGKHKVPQKLSKKGLKEYDLRMAKIRKRDLRKARPQRRQVLVRNAIG